MNPNWEKLEPGHKVYIKDLQHELEMEASITVKRDYVFVAESLDHRYSIMVYRKDLEKGIMLIEHPVKSVPLNRYDILNGISDKYNIGNIEITCFEEAQSFLTDHLVPLAAADPPGFDPDDLTIVFHILNHWSEPKQMMEEVLPLLRRSRGILPK